MIKNLKTKIAALVLGAALVPMLMGPTGGVPSRPTFQMVTATTTASRPATPCSNLTSQVAVCNSSVAGYGWSNTGATTDLKNWDVYADNAGTLHFRMINDAAGGALDWMTVGPRTGITKTPVAILGSPIPKFIYGNGGGIGTCAIINNQGITTCTRGSAGSYTLNFTSGYASSSSYSCTASPTVQGTAVVTAEISTTSATTATVQTKTAGTNTDNNFQFICAGS